MPVAIAPFSFVYDGPEQQHAHELICQVRRDFPWAWTKAIDGFLKLKTLLCDTAEKPLIVAGICTEHNN